MQSDSLQCTPSLDSFISLFCPPPALPVLPPVPPPSSPSLSLTAFLCLFSPLPSPLPLPSPPPDGGGFFLALSSSVSLPPPCRLCSLPAPSVPLSLLASPFSFTPSSCSSTLSQQRWSLLHTSVAAFVLPLLTVSPISSLVGKPASGYSPPPFHEFSSPVSCFPSLHS